ncbi:hypothetical protein ACN1SX_002131 [Vibrio cholerae]
MKKKYVLINASAAKSGGALTILNLFCLSKSTDESSFYYIVSPFEPDVLPKHSRWIKLSTSGFRTILFSLFLVNIYYFKYGCDKLISFSNVNSFLSLKERVTYFHNILICDSNDFKYRLIRFSLKFLNQRKCKYIFQTTYVLKKFRSAINDVESYYISWPGLDSLIMHNMSCSKNRLTEPLLRSFVVPIVNLDDYHKNFRMVLDIARRVSPNMKVEFRVTSEPNSSMDFPENIKFIGRLSRNDFLRELANSDGLLNVSTSETLCLPIFESICMNKPSIVFKADYLSGLYEHFPTIDGLFVFSNINEACSLLESASLVGCNVRVDAYTNGDWGF